MGRIGTRTDRWYALLGLAYETARDASSHLDELEHARWVVARKPGPRPKRGLRSHISRRVYLTPSSISRALDRAEERGIFQQQAPRLPRVRGAATGFLTNSGWAALGAVPTQWTKQIGPHWVSPPVEDAEAALDIIGREMVDEQERARQDEMRRRTPPLNDRVSDSSVG